MLNVTPARRADLEKICAHWWVNETYTESCLEVAEELANQTPVRLDLLLSLAPPPPRVGSDKLLVGSDQDEGDALLDNAVLPTRSQSAGSLMELDHPLSERKIREFEQLDKRRGSIGGESKDIPPKRKLEEGISTDDAAHGGAKRKDRSRRRDREKSSDRRQHRSSSRTKQAVDSADKTFSPKKETSKTKTDKDSDELMDVDVEPPILSSSETLKPSESKPDQQLDDKIVKDQTSSLVVTDVTENNEDVSKPVEVATEITPHATLKTPEKESIKTATSEKSTRKSVKVSKKSKTAPLDSSIPVLTAASESKDELSNKAKCNKVPEAEPKTEGHSESKQENKENTAVKVKKKNIIGAKSEGVIVSKEMGDEFTKRDLDSRQLSRDITVAPGHTTINVGTSNDETMNGIIDKDLSESKENVIPQEVVKTKKTIKTKKSKEKFNNLLSGANEPRSPTSEKPKKVFIPGVKVSDYKQAYERKSSISGPSVLERKSSFSGPAPSTPVKSSSSKKSLKPTSDISKSDLTILNNDPESNKESVDNSVQAKSLNNTQNSEVKSSSKSTILKNDKKDENKASNLKTLTQRSENLNGTVNEEKGGHTKEIVDEEDSDLKLVPALPVKDKSVGQEQARIKKLKDAVEIIGNAITEENKRESSVDSSRKVSSGKPPVPNDSKIKSKVGGNGALSPKSPPTSPIDHALGKKTVRVQVGPNDIRLATVQVGSPESTKVPLVDTKRTLLAEVPVNEVQTSIDEDAEIKAEGQSVTDENITEDGKTSEQPTKKKTAKVEITLKSATLPRRKTSKAEIQIGYPSNQVPKVQFHTEVAHMVGGATLPMMPTKLKTQRSEVAFPVAAALPPEHHRSASLEPEGTIANKPKPREHIIPIQFEREGEKERPQVSSPPPGQARPPVPPLQQQKSQRGSLSRQSTADSDTESTISAGPELIRKSPREFIIPIAVEGGGYITPRASSLEPSVSETSTEQSNKFPTRTSGRFSRPRRMSSLLSESGASEDEVFNSISSPFATLQRHSSLTRDSDNPDDDKPLHHMHRLRSSRPSRHPLEHNDSLSSAEEEEDDDDGFEILTAESLFSTLLSRVRSLTQRLNVEDGGRPGFPSSRLMSHLASTANPTASSFFSNVYGDHPTSREADLSSALWRRSVSRDATDADSMQSETANTMKGPTPRGSPRSDYGGNDDAANELSDSTSHSYTPSLSKRLHRQYQDSGSSSSHRDYLPPTRKSLLDSQNSDTTTTQYTEGMRFESGKSISEDTCQDNQNTNSPSSTNIDSNTSTNKLNIEPKSRSQIPSLLRFRSSSLSRDIDKVKPKKDYQVSETDKEPKAVTSSRNTPERSILSKFFRPGSVDRNTGETVKDTKEKKKSSGSTRRISRFLRPDFFDTPREESEYVKEKEAKKVADAEAKSKARKKKIVEKLEAARLENDVKKTSVDANAKRKDVSPKKEFEKGNKLHVNCKMETINSKDNIKNNSSKKDIKKLSNEDVEDSTHEEDSKSKPKGKNGGTKNDLFEKQNSTSNAKSRFFHSLEKKLEKFRSTGDDIPSATSGKSRVDKAIRSLREQSLGPRSSDLITTESNLIKRAVSADDCSIVPHTGNHLSKFNNASNSKLGSKVNSVLGLFRKLEDTPGAQLKKSQQRPKSMVINRVKRTQSMYTGSQSDGVLSSSIDDMLNDTPIPPLRLKRNSFGTCSDNDVKAPENLAGKEVTKKTKPFDKLTCSDARNDSSLTTIPPNKNNVSAQLSEGVQQKSESLGTVESKVSKIVKIDQCKSKSLKETLVSEEYLDKNLLQNVSFKSLPSGLTKGGGFKPMVNVGIKVDTTANIPKELLKAGNSKAIPRPTSLKGLTEIPLLNITTTDTANKIVNNVSGGSKIPQSNKHMLNKEWESGNMAPAIPSQSNPQSTNSSPNILPTEPNISPLNEFSLNDDEMKFAGMKKSDTLSYPADDSSSLLSPADESGSQSFDSWSVCSDVDGHEYPTSPIPVSGVSEDTEESVCDRIRRKSFYTRFNDIKRKNRKSSVPILSSSYLSSNVDPYSSHNSKKAHSSKVGSFQHEDIPSHDSFRADNDLPYGKKSPIPFKDYYVNSNGEHDNNFTMNSNNCNIPNGHVENVPSKLVENSQDMTVLETNNNVPERESSSQVLTDVYSKYVDGNAMNRLRSIPTHHTKSSEVGGYSYNPPDNSTSLYGGIPRTERRLSRPADFLKDSRRSLSMLPGLYSSLRVPTAWDGMSVSTGRLGSSLTPVGDYSNTLSRHRSAGGDASIHGKYNRYNSRSPTESPLLAGNLRENHWSERPTTPH
uniref:Uncharacterized protein n=1 Tax=Timema shepardi TaxID=629360 RepID=A0A7R9AQN0_TIMSH|nr:unnamed protein product [Timema shepardi]